MAKRYATVILQRTVVYEFEANKDLSHEGEIEMIRERIKTNSPIGVLSDIQSNNSVVVVDDRPEGV